MPLLKQYEDAHFVAPKNIPALQQLQLIGFFVLVSYQKLFPKESLRHHFYFLKLHQSILDRKQFHLH